MPFNVLIVDDSSAIRKVLQRVLMQTDLAIDTIYEAGDGAQALDKLREHEVSLVLSDINMPNMDGLEFLQRVSDENRTVPVIMISTEGSQTKVLRAVELGARGYVRKPFTVEQIKEKICAAL